MAPDSILNIASTESSPVDSTVSGIVFSRSRYDSRSMPASSGATPDGLDDHTGPEYLRELPHVVLNDVGKVHEHVETRSPVLLLMAPWSDDHPVAAAQGYLEHQVWVAQQAVVR